MKKIIILLLLVWATIATLAVTAQVSPTTKQCKGTTTKGLPCKSIMVLSDGYCRMHSPNTARCGAITAAGKPCKMVVKKAGDRCRFHQGK